MGRHNAWMGRWSCRVTLVSLLLVATACATVEGGEWVKDDYQAKVLQSYQSEGEVDPTVSQQLVETDKGLGFLQRDSDGKGLLFQTHWSDAHGDHFAVWLKGSIALEVVIPADRSQPGYRFIYPSGFYEVETRGELEHPVPNVLVPAGSKLTPVGPGGAPTAPPPGQPNPAGAG